MQHQINDEEEKLFTLFSRMSEIGVLQAMEGDSSQSEFDGSQGSIGWGEQEDATNTAT